jgi:hypothetical protein
MRAPITDRRTMTHILRAGLALIETGECCTSLAPSEQNEASNQQCPCSRLEALVTCCAHENSGSSEAWSEWTAPDRRSQQLASPVGAVSVLFVR